MLCAVWPIQANRYFSNIWTLSAYLHPLWDELKGWIGGKLPDLIVDHQEGSGRSDPYIWPRYHFLGQFSAPISFKAVVFSRRNEWLLYALFWMSVKYPKSFSLNLQPGSKLRHREGLRVPILCILQSFYCLLSYDICYRRPCSFYFKIVPRQQQPPDFTACIISCKKRQFHLQTREQTWNSFMESGLWDLFAVFSSAYTSFSW